MTTRPMREHGLLVVLQVPTDWTADKVARELAGCISFGHPRVSVIYDVPAPERPAPGTETISFRTDAL